MSLLSRLTEIPRIRETLVRDLYGDKAPLTEALSSSDLADVLIALDDVGWQRLGGPNTDNGNEFSPIDRVNLVKRSRLYWHRDPLSKQAVRLYTVYALGKGIEVQYKANAFVQERLKKFTADNLNRKFLGKVGLRRLSNKLLIDGELFMTLIYKNRQRPQVRLIDPLQITSIITNPDDSEDIWFYERRPPGGDQSQPLYYPAADAEWGGDSMLEAIATLSLDQQKAIRKGLQTYTRCVHITINNLGQRGYPLLTPALDWSRQHKRFMENRATMQQVATQYAYKKTVKGGQSTVDQIAASLRAGNSTVPGGSQSTGYDQRGPLTGSTLLQNQGIDTEQFKFDTMAASAQVDERMIVLQVLRAVGMSEHYFADSSSGNLATATSMERPQELTLLEYQDVFLWGITCVYSEVCEIWDEDTDDLLIEAPPLLNLNLPEYMRGLSSVLQSIPEINKPFLWRKILVALEVDDVDGVMKGIIDEQNQAKLAAQSVAIAPVAGQVPVAASVSNGNGHHSLDLLFPQFTVYPNIREHNRPGDHPEKGSVPSAMGDMPAGINIVPSDLPAGFGASPYALNDAYATWYGSLSPEQNAALAFYVTQDSTNMNGYLSGRPIQTTGNLAEKTAAIETHVHNLDAALASTRTPADMTVYRGFMLKDDLHVGDTFVHSGYTSTSVDRDVARNFANSDINRGDGALAVIHVPAGSHGAWINNDSVNDGSNIKASEFEMLLPRSTSYRVTEVDNRRDTPVYTLEYLGEVTPNSEGQPDSESIRETRKNKSDLDKRNRFIWQDDDLVWVKRAKPVDKKEVDTGGKK